MERKGLHYTNSPENEIVVDESATIGAETTAWYCCRMLLKADLEKLFEPL